MSATTMMNAPPRSSAIASSVKQNRGFYGAIPNWPEHKLHHHATDETLKKLYAAAAALLFPSLDEGFGLPVLESIAANCPVLCSDIPALRESFGNAPIYLPLESRAWADALRNATAHPPVLDPEARAEVLARHEWPRVIAAHLALIGEVLSGAVACGETCRK